MAREGSCYVQHPFYPFIRKPLAAQAGSDLAARRLVDIVEVRNGGPFTGRSDSRALAWAREQGLPAAAGSDAHEPPDIGQCVTAVPPGPLEPASLAARLREGVVVDRHRSSALQIATKAATGSLPSFPGGSGGSRASVVY